MKSSLERRILLFTFLALTLALSVNTWFNVDSFRRSYRDGVLQRAQTFALALKGQIESVVSLGLPLDEIDGISVRCQEIVGNDPEISYCMVEDSAGQVLYHSNGNFPQVNDVRFLESFSAHISALDSTTMGKQV